MGTKGKEKKLNGIQSLILLLLIIASVAACIHLKTGGLIIGLLFNWVIIYLFCLGNRSDYERILDGAFDALKVGVLDCILRLFVGGSILLLVTMLVGYATSIVNCSSPVFHVLTDRLMAPMFRERKIAPEILPRCIEDSGTLAGPMIPWTAFICRARWAWPGAYFSRICFCCT